MLRESIAAYTELLHGPVDFQWTERPELLVARNNDQLTRAHQKARAIADQGVSVEYVDADDMRAEMPHLAEDLAGGVVLHGAYSLDPAESLHAVMNAARSAGATIQTGLRVAQVMISGDRVDGIVTDEGPMAADTVVLASGPWLPDLFPAVALKPGRGWLMRSAVPEFKVPWIIEEVSWPDQVMLGAAAVPQTLGEIAAGGNDSAIGESFVLSPQLNGQMLLGASLSSSLRDAVEGIEAPGRLARRALAIAPGLERELRISRAWWGLRPMTPDGLPLVGRTDVEGLWIHGGHASLGVQAAPGTARWLADQIQLGTSNDTLARLAPGRFGCV